jgi:hypothetical protein
MKNTYILREHLSENCRAYTSDTTLKWDASLGAWVKSGRGNLSMGGWKQTLSEEEAARTVECWRNAPAKREQENAAILAKWQKDGAMYHSILLRPPLCLENKLEFIELESGA